jgi:hypothetical protein
MSRGEIEGWHADRVRPSIERAGDFLFQFSTVVDARNSFSNARSQLRVKCLNAATAADTSATATHTLTKPSRYIKIIRLIHSICSADPVHTEWVRYQTVARVQCGS